MTSTSAEPTYLAIASQIEDRIRQGDLKPGDRAPSTRQITREWGIAMATATKVLAELRPRGRVAAPDRRRARRGDHDAVPQHRQQGRPAGRHDGHPHG